MNTFAWTLRVTSPDRRTGRVTTRRQQFVVTRPLNFDVEHDGVSALEYALGAIGAELVTGLWEIARRRRLHLDNLEAVVTGELKNPLAYLEVVGEEGDASMSRVRIKLYVTSPEPEASVQDLFRQTIGLLPLARTFRNLVQVDLQVVLTP